MVTYFSQLPVFQDHFALMFNKLYYKCRPVLANHLYYKTTLLFSLIKYIVHVNLF